MKPIKTFIKTSREVQDYDIKFTRWLTGLADTGSSVQVVPDVGITVITSSLINGIVKVWLSGGVDESVYHIRVKLTTVGSRQKEVLLIITVVD